VVLHGLLGAVAGRPAGKVLPEMLKLLNIVQSFSVEFKAVEFKAVEFKG
jgi:hypothetical protein